MDEPITDDEVEHVGVGKLHVVHCLHCGKVVGQVRLVTGLESRYRCRNCGDYTNLIVPDGWVKE